MGNFLRLVVFILALGVLAAGTGALLLREGQRERELERRVQTGKTADASALLEDVRANHAHTQRATLLLAGLALACLVTLAVIPARRAEPEPAVDPDRARTEMRGLESLARATAAQRLELDHEREARHRSEQDLHLQQLLVNRALQDKVRLGRDLHDGLVQILYATGLVLETAAQRLAAATPDPAEAARLIERATGTLNAAIREARGTIGGLTPDALENQSLSVALAAVLDHLDAARRCEVKVDLDPELPGVTDPVRTELLQITREAVSNALRHGGAKRVDLRLVAMSDGGLELTVRDDGRGFDPAAVTRGHGLDNLAARARSLGASLEIDSAPGRGAQICLRVPADSSARVTRDEGVV